MDEAEKNKILRENNALLNQFLKSQTQINDEAQTELRITRDINNEIRDGLKLVSQEKDLKSTIRASLSAINKVAEQNFKISELDVKNLSTSASIQEKINTLAKDRQNLTIQQKDIGSIINQKIQEGSGLEGKKLENNIQQIAALKKVQAALAEQVIASEEYAKNLKMALQFSKDVEKNSGVAKNFKALGGIVDKIPGLSGLGDAFTAGGDAAKTMAARMTRTNAAGKTAYTATQINLAAMSKGMKAFGGIVTKVLLPLAILKGILDFDKQTGQMAKDLNMTYETSTKLNSQFNDIANTSLTTSINTKALGETYSHINKTLGTNVMLNKEDLKTFTKLHKTAGLTNEELMGTMKLTLGTNKSLKDATGEVLAQSKIASLKNGVALNEKEILKDIGKVSAATTLSLGKNPGQIAAAVATAKSLGMELGKVEAIAGSLLEFESSIESELEAELLLGRDINLEKARTFALNNDMAGVAKEIEKQAGSAADFGKMNRIEQDALAKAVGMGREELAETLFIQDQLKGATGEQAASREKALNRRIKEVGLAQAQQELADKGIETLENQNSVSERIEKVTGKIQDAFMAMAPAVLAIVEPLVQVFEIFTGILGLVGLVGEYSKMAGEYLFGWIPALGIVGTLFKGIASIGVILAAYMAFQSLSAIPYVGAILGTIAAAAVLAAGFGLLSGIKTGNDVMSPGESGGGYGNRTLFGPEGAIALNNKDTVIAGTNLFPKGNDVMSTGAGEIQMPAPADNSRMEGLLESLVRDQRARPVIANPGVIQIQ